MNEKELRAWIFETYNVRGDCPWEDNDSTVFRHAGNRKWFGLLMHIPPVRLRRSRNDGNPKSAGSSPLAAGTDPVTILNVKVDPITLGAFLGKPGYYPAYHMNKSTWITIDVNAVEEADLKLLIDLSFDATR